ncbi:efflux RND transporter periplasmic adaptor subunit [Bacteroides sp. AM10-21B]|uniref:efflux RND transporter periplasmic adaptor subunit n=1 Tax=Bacteroides sp. AM10-21B TaxID=2292001 RepID=UPI000E4D4D61|nr:efflux RND transporter periplasmic adaptor subunit [Bacteroides sp. AM10-21B]RHJ53870.1 efflux RND transporter periplasmic adaptor subunit [Bacteroides sp. AM10-21B]
MTTKKSMMKQVITVICSAVLAACGNAPAVQNQSEYQVMDITISDKELQTTYSAAIRGRQDIDIYPQVSGTLTRLCVEEGQAVRKGQILFIIDQVPYIAALRTAEANVEAAKAAVATSRLTYDSKRELYAQKVVSEFDLKTSYNSLLSAKAQLAQAEAQQINAANNLSYTEVKSPADGVVGILPYRVGTLVSAGMPKPLTTVSDNSDMYIYFSMTENQMLELTRRYGSKDKALAEMPAVSLQLNDRSTYAQEGKIETISGVIDTSTGTVSLRAVFPNKEGLLTSGGSGNIIIPVKKENCIVIPQAATYEVQDKVFVYKVVDGKAQSAPVQVTRVNGGQEYIVENGLQAGDVIVVEGVGLLREGAPIAPKPASANQQVKEG